MKLNTILFAILLFSGLTSTGQITHPIALGQSKFLGCAYSTPQATDFARYWNQLTPENAAKWGSVEGTRNVMNWSALDAAYNFAKNNHIPFKLHTLVWGAQQPSWIGGLDSASQRKEIEEWFKALADRYDSVAYIDVVNEPMNNAPNGMTPWGASVPNVNYAKALGGAGITGWDWVITSFRLARKYFPHAKLIMNEYNVINNNAATQNYIKIINLLKSDTLIDGIGEQAHAFTTGGVSTSILKNNLDLLAGTGIPIYLTEMDIDGLTDPIQLKEYQRVFSLFWNHPAVMGITLWGFRTGLWRNAQGAYLITQSGIERPAMKWLKAYVNDTLTLVQSISVSADADSIYVGDKVKFSALVSPSNATIPQFSWNVLQENLGTIDASGNFTGTAAGKETIKAISWDGSNKIGSYVIVISNRLADSITILTQPGIQTIYAGDTLQMKATVFPANATNKGFSWSVTPEGLATISSTGVLRALSAGRVVVQSMTSDGSSVSDTLGITIVEKLPSAISNKVFQNVQLFPNPAINGIFILSGIQDIGEITVMNLTGEPVSDFRNSGQSTMNISLQVMPGIYILKFVSGNQFSYRKVVIR
jgi:endo-1,4-beta-xylanase